MAKSVTVAVKCRYDRLRHLERYTTFTSRTVLAFRSRTVPRTRLHCKFRNRSSVRKGVELIYCACVREGSHKYNY